MSLFENNFAVNKLDYEIVQSEIRIGVCIKMKNCTAYTLNYIYKLF